MSFYRSLPVLGSLSSISSSGTLDLNPDTIFEDAVQFEPPQNSLSQDSQSAEMNSFRKYSKIFLSGTNNVVAKKSLPPTVQTVQVQETRHFHPKLLQPLEAQRQPEVSLSNQTNSNASRADITSTSNVPMSMKAPEQAQSSSSSSTPKNPRTYSSQISIPPKPIKRRNEGNAQAANAQGPKLPSVPFTYRAKGSARNTTKPQLLHEKEFPNTNARPTIDSSSKCTAKKLTPPPVCLALSTITEESERVPPNRVQKVITQSDSQRVERNMVINTYLVSNSPTKSNGSTQMEIIETQTPTIIETVTYSQPNVNLQMPTPTSSDVGPLPNEPSGVNGMQLNNQLEVTKSQRPKRRFIKLPDHGICRNPTFNGIGMPQRVDNLNSAKKLTDSKLQKGNTTPNPNQMGSHTPETDPQKAVPKHATISTTTNQHPNSEIKIKIVKQKIPPEIDPTFTEDSEQPCSSKHKIWKITVRKAKSKASDKSDSDRAMIQKLILKRSKPRFQNSKRVYETMSKSRSPVTKNNSMNRSHSEVEALEGIEPRNSTPNPNPTQNPQETSNDGDGSNVNSPDMPHTASATGESSDDPGPHASADSEASDKQKTGSDPAPVSKETLMLIFGEVITFCPIEFFNCASDGLPGVSRDPCHEPMDLITIKKMLHDSEITTLSSLNRNLSLTLFNGFMAYDTHHIMHKKSTKALRKLMMVFERHRLEDPQQPQPQNRRGRSRVANFKRHITEEETQQTLEMIRKHRRMVSLSTNPSTRQGSVSPDITDFSTEEMIKERQRQSQQ